MRLSVIGDSPQVGPTASSAALFATLRDRVEALGIFVLLIGNLGVASHQSRRTRVPRVCDSDNVAPFIVINDQDATAAQSFTLIHELVHVFTGSTGVSAAPSAVPPQTQLAHVERFCNDVASEVLLPHSSLPMLRQADAAGCSRSDQISGVAASRNVSEAMVAYRYWRTGERAAAEVYRQLAAAYAARWRAARARRREHHQQAAGSGPTYYTVRKHRLGKPLINLIGRAWRSNELTHTKAAKILGVKPSSVEPLLSGAERKTSLTMCSTPHTRRTWPEEEAGRDPFLVAYGLMGENRTIVTKEISRPSKVRGRRTLPDACNIMNIPWSTDFEFYRARNFRIP